MYHDTMIIQPLHVNNCQSGITWVDGLAVRHWLVLLRRLVVVANGTVVGDIRADKSAMSDIAAEIFQYFIS